MECIVGQCPLSALKVKQMHWLICRQFIASDLPTDEHKTDTRQTDGETDRQTKTDGQTDVQKPQWA